MYQEIAEASDEDAMQQIINESPKRVFRFTPDNFTDLGFNETTEAYKNSLLELGEGELKKYDQGKKDNQMDFNEFYTMQKSVQTRISAEDAQSFDSWEMRLSLMDIFKVMDVDKNGVLDTRELATQFALMDAVDGEMDGEIDILLNPTASENFAQQYKNLHNFIFTAPEVVAA